MIFGQVIETRELESVEGFTVIACLSTFKGAETAQVNVMLEDTVMGTAVFTTNGKINYDLAELVDGLDMVGYALDNALATIGVLDDSNYADA